MPIAAIAASLCFAGCATQIDPGKAANLVKRLFNTKPKTVSCPSGVTAKAGHTFNCRVSFTDGSAATVTIHMTDSGGRVEVGPSDVHLSVQLSGAGGSSAGSSSTPAASTPTTSSSPSTNTSGSGY